jgi:hypothetical protein
MAGERRADALECVQEAERLIDLGEILDQIADQLRHVWIAERRGQLAHEHRALAERLEHQAEPELLTPLHGFDRRVEVDHLRQQQALARTPPG